MSDPVIRLNVALQGRYRVERELGEGGMATVFLADDLKHERKVALKVLKPELAAVVGAERFLAEIKTTANLQHPHILPLFDSGEANGFLFYVMPYVEGESLRDRIDREKQLPVDEAVRIATAVANALDHAHRHNVIHRDIKPANILLQDGEPVVADFGIALAVGAGGGDRLTETGLSLGTPFYMSPEQATGDQPVGSSTDTYALGSVLYEMLTGDPPYMGSTAQAVLGQIISAKPISATDKRPSIPANVDATVRKALEKLPADRFKSAQDFARALGDGHFRYGEAEVGVGAAASPWNRLTIATTTLTALLALTLGWSLLRPEPPQPPEPVTRVSVLMGEDESFHPNFGELDLSTDGSLMVYRGRGDEGQSQLWVRRWDALEATPIRNTDRGGAWDPAISPDGREVAFRAGYSIRVVPLEGGASRTLLTDSARCCLSWSPEGDWVYYTRLSQGLSRVPASGGPSEVVTQVDTAAGDLFHGSADAVPGGRVVLFTTGDGSIPRIQALDLETGELRDLTPGRTPRYSPTGHLLFMDANEGTLSAAPFDVKNLELTGAAVPMAEGVLQNPQGSRFFDISASGRLVYRTGATAGIYTPVWVERNGTFREIDTEWTFDPGSDPGGPIDYRGLSLSPDGTRLAVTILDDANYDIWIKELPRGPLTRLTFDEGADFRPRWTPDGNAVTFLSDRREALSTDIFLKRTSFTGDAQLIMDHELPFREGAYSPDGAWLIARTDRGTLNAGGDIWSFRPDRDTVPAPLVVTDYDVKAISISPNGRWLMYESNETGRNEVYVRPLPDVDEGKWTVSTAGGVMPRWAHSGREVFYVNADNEMVAAQVLPGAVFQVGDRSVLFPLDDDFLFLQYERYALYDVAPGDDRFIWLGARTNETVATHELILVENFFEELKERVPN